MNGFKIMESEGFDYGKLASQEVSNEVFLTFTVLIIIMVVVAIIVVLNYKNNKKN
ncbi:hypothetical protein Flavo103_21490 [Flavobacterium collinsii]|nr:hypothetical protein Flavo103_21490 [Flavobacterium collinsii]